MPSGAETRNRTLAKVEYLFGGGKDDGQVGSTHVSRIPKGSSETVLVGQKKIELAKHFRHHQVCIRIHGMHINRRIMVKVDLVFSPV